MASADNLCWPALPAPVQLGLPLLCDDARLGHKGIMHRHVRQLDRPSKVRRKQLLCVVNVMCVRASTC